MATIKTIYIWSDETGTGAWRVISSLEQNIAVLSDKHLICPPLFRYLCVKPENNGRTDSQTPTLLDLLYTSTPQYKSYLSIAVIYNYMLNSILII